jgi:hypothetical protein
VHFLSKSAPVEASKRFLQSYVESLLLIQQNPNVDVVKGKQAVDTRRGFGRKKRCPDERPQTKQKWRPPDADVTKLNVDEAFSQDGRAAGAGIVLRSSNGMVIFAACRKLNA